MAMEIHFDYEKLNKDNRRIYDAMTDAEKQVFEKTWITIETQKAKLVQQKNRTKERVQREKKALSEKTRKERTHRLIERGAILESFLESPESMTNEEVKEVLKDVFSRTAEPRNYGSGDSDEATFSRPFF